MSGRDTLNLSKSHLDLLKILREWTNGNTVRSMAFETILKRWPCPDREGLVGVARDLEVAGLVELVRPYANWPVPPGASRPDIAIGASLTTAGIMELLKAHPADMEREESTSDEVFRHSTDYISVNIQGKAFTLTPRQAEVIKLLHGAYTHKTPDLHQDYIKAELQMGDTAQVRGRFRRAPDAWKCLIAQGARKGTLRLNI